MNEETIIFDFRYKDLQYNAFICEFPKFFMKIRYLNIIALTLWTASKQYDEYLPLGSTLVSLFDENLRLREGNYNLMIWPDSIPDCSSNSSTPGNNFNII